MNPISVTRKGTRLRVEINDIARSVALQDEYEMRGRSGA
jgi:hypothetical protein